MSRPRILAALLTAAALTACAPAADPPPGPVSAAATSAAPATARAGRPAPDFPPRVTAFTHRGTYWFVVVAVARSRDDPRLAAATRSLADVGYPGVDAVEVTECDEGLPEGLGLRPGDYPPYRFHVSPAFPDAATAQRFVDAYQPGVVGTFEVVTGCMD